MTVRCGDTLLFQTLPVIAAGAAVGGKKESEGPLAAEFDELSADNRFGQSSWEAAEKYLQLRAARLCLQKAALPQEKVQLALAGDLQAQCTASSYAMRELGVPFAGLFGACSTMAEGLALGAALCEGGAARNLLAMASSHFCAAERQFRTPLSYGAVRTPTAQWTATAAGCCLLQPQGEGVGIAAATFGRVQDYQVKDINNMGLPWPRQRLPPCCTILRIPAPNRRSSTASIPATLGRWQSAAAGAAGRRRLADQKPCGLRVHPVRCKRAERKERRLRPGLLRGGAVRAHPAAPAAGAARSGCCSQPPGPDEPDHLFAEGDHPGGGASGGAACAGKGEVR